MKPELSPQLGQNATTELEWREVPLLGMSKRGDVYLRTLLIHGARSAILAARRRNDRKNGWLANLLARRHANIVAVALANKNVRTVWALLAHGRDFKPDYVPLRAAA